MLFIALLLSGARDVCAASQVSPSLRDSLVSIDPDDLYNSKNDVLPADTKTNPAHSLSNINKTTIQYIYKTNQDRATLGHNLDTEKTSQSENALKDNGHDFNYSFANDLPLHPYMAGMTGGAMPDYTSPPTASALALQSDGMSPLFRVGAGAAYRLGSQWNLSLDYQAGVTGTNDQIFTGRSQQPIDLQVLNMGMHYQF